MMQSIELQAVTQARASDDYHPGNNQWKIGLSSMFAHAIGVKPTKDNFWSTRAERGRYGNDTETRNRMQSLVSTLSTGPVAPSDDIGGSDVDLIMRSCRKDGKLLQPDRPAVLSQRTILARAGLTDSSDDGEGEVWVTLSTISDLKWHYVVAIDSKARNFTADDLAGNENVVTEMRAWESNNTKTIIAFDSTKPIQLPDTDEYNFNFWTAAPVLSNGFVFMGEAETKWVAVSQDRFSELVVYPDMFYVTAEGYPGEEITMLYLEPDKLSPVAFKCTFSESSTLKVQVSQSGGVCMDM
jgi:hypothetical protein